MKQTLSQRPKRNYTRKRKNKDKNNNNIDNFNLKPRVKSSKSKSTKTKSTKTKTCTDTDKKNCKTDGYETEGRNYLSTDTTDDSYYNNRYNTRGNDKIKYIQLLDNRKGRGAECPGIEIPSNLTFFKRFYGLDPSQNEKDPFTEVDTCKTPECCNYIDCDAIAEPIECACPVAFAPESYFAGPVNNFNNHNEIQNGNKVPKDYIPMILCSIPKDNNEESSEDETRCVKSKQAIEKQTHTIQEFKKYNCGPDDRNKTQRYPRYKFKNPYSEEPMRKAPACLEPSNKPKHHQRKPKEGLDGTFIFVPQDCNEQRTCSPQRKDCATETHKECMNSQHNYMSPQQFQMNGPPQLCDACQSQIPQNTQNELQLLKQIQHQINTYMQNLSSPNNFASCQDKINQIQRILKDPMCCPMQFSMQNTCQNASSPLFDSQPIGHTPVLIPPSRPPQPMLASPPQPLPHQSQQQVAKLIPVKLAKMPPTLKSDEAHQQAGYARAYYLKPRKGAPECEYTNNDT